MPRVLNRIEIARDIGDVYDFVTNPATWPNWHPSTCKVTVTATGPLRAGGRVSEEFQAFGLRHRVDWTVIESHPPRRWVAAGAHRGGAATLEYTMEQSPGGTLVSGLFVYQFDSIWGRLFDAFVIREKLGGESLEAVLRLKRLLENQCKPE